MSRDTTELNGTTYKIVERFDDITQAPEWKLFLTTPRAKYLKQNMLTLFELWDGQKPTQGACCNGGLISLNDSIRRSGFVETPNDEIRVKLVGDYWLIVDGTKRAAILIAMKRPVPALLVTP